MKNKNRSRNCRFNCLLFIKKFTSKIAGGKNNKRRCKMLEEIVSLMAEEELAIAEHKAMLRAYQKIQEKLVLKQPQEESTIDSASEEFVEVGG